MLLRRCKGWPTEVNSPHGKFSHRYNVDEFRESIGREPRGEKVFIDYDKLEIDEQHFVEEALKDFRCNDTACQLCLEAVRRKPRKEKP